MALPPIQQRWTSSQVSSLPGMDRQMLRAIHFIFPVAGGCLMSDSRKEHRDTWQNQAESQKSREAGQQGPPVNHMCHLQPCGFPRGTKSPSCFCQVQRCLDPCNQKQSSDKRSRSQTVLNDMLRGQRSKKISKSNLGSRNELYKGCTQDGVASISSTTEKVI